MRVLLPIVSVLLALTVAGVIAYIAWEVIKQASGERPANRNESPTDEN